MPIMRCDPRIRKEFTVANQDLRLLNRLYLIFRTAIDEEKKAQKMYKDAMEICQDDALREVLEGFYEDEVRHEYELMEQYEKLRRRIDDQK